MCSNPMAGDLLLVHWKYELMSLVPLIALVLAAVKCVCMGQLLVVRKFCMVHMGSCNICLAVFLGLYSWRAGSVLIWWNRWCTCSASDCTVC